MSIFDWFDERLDLRSIHKGILDREVPDRLTWWHTLGSATKAAFLLETSWHERENDGAGCVLRLIDPDHVRLSLSGLFAHQKSPQNAILRTGADPS